MGIEYNQIIKLYFYRNYKTMKKIFSLFVASLIFSVSSNALSEGLLTQFINAASTLKLTAPAPTPAMALGAGAKIEVGFSPEGSAEALVLKVIDSTQKEIRMMSYSFTSPKVVKALVNAHKRGVDISLIADASNLTQKSGNAALSVLSEAGIGVRTISTYKIHHDKILVSDRKTLQSGSFNYSAAAAKSNSENVLVLWNAPDVASTYLGHWKSRWDQGTEFKAGY